MLSSPLRRWLLGLLTLLVLMGVGYWAIGGRVGLMLWMVKYTIRQDYGPNQAVRWATPASMPATGTAEKRPNIILIVADDLGFNDITAHGGGVAQGTVPTPNIDSLAKNGVDFLAGYSGNATCAPSRAAMMTGRYPTRFGFEFTPTPKQFMKVIVSGQTSSDLPKPIYHAEREADLIPYEDMGLPVQEVTLARALKNSGYRTLQLGKWHLGGTGYLPTDQGFDVNIGGSHVGQPGSYIAPFGKDVTPMPTDVTPGEFLTDRLTNEAIKLIDQNSDKPFFLYFPQYAVHTPIQAKQEDIDRFKPASQQSAIHHNTKYAGLIWNLDQNVGKLIEHLRATGKMNDTLFLFTSDNGGLLPVTNNAPLRAGKGFPYEGGVRVPGFAYWPGHIPVGKKIDERVISMDFSATVLEAAGSRAKVQDGSSFYRALVGQPFHQSRPFVWHYPQYHTSGNTPCSAMIDGKYKVVHHYETGLNELYDLERDPTENTNLSVVQSDLTAKLWLKLKGLLDSMGAQYPIPRK